MRSVSLQTHPSRPSLEVFVAEYYGWNVDLTIVVQDSSFVSQDRHTLLAESGYVLRSEFNFLTVSNHEA
jgi:hypothetical protein